MPPFFTSQTPIAKMDTRLAGSVGDRLGAGIQQGVQAFMAGVEQKRMKDEKKAQDDAALQFAVKAAPMLGLDPNDTESLKAGIKGMGGGAQFLKFAQDAQSEAVRNQYTQALTQQLQTKMLEDAATKGKLSDIWAASKTATEDGNSKVDFESFMVGASDAGISPERAAAFAAPMLPTKEREKPYVIDVEGEKYLIHGNNTPVKLGPGVDKLTDSQKAQITSIRGKRAKLESALVGLTTGNLGYSAEASNPATITKLEKDIADLQKQENDILGVKTEPAPAVAVPSPNAQAPTSPVGRFKIVTE